MAIKNTQYLADIFDILDILKKEKKLCIQEVDNLCASLQDFEDDIKDAKAIETTIDLEDENR